MDANRKDSLSETVLRGAALREKVSFPVKCPGGGRRGKGMERFGNGVDQVPKEL